MDAVEFIKKQQKMCNAYKEECIGCPMNGEPCGGYRDVDAERLVGVVEAWSAAHPLKTRQSVFLEQWPEAEIDYQGILVIEPCGLDKTETEKRDCYNSSCDDCRREFWMQEVE